jgi:preprotein translocase subunit SecB
MASDQPNQSAPEEKTDTNPSPLPGQQPISLQLYGVQLIDILPIEIVARRFPVVVSNPALPMNVQFNIVELSVDPENSQAQVALEVKVEPSEEPHFFEILFKLLALFTYKSEYTPEMVVQFLQHGSLSLMLPFARELILSLSTRLHLPPIVLSLVQLASPPTSETE